MTINNSQYKEMMQNVEQAIGKFTLYSSLLEEEGLSGRDEELAQALDDAVEFLTRARHALSYIALA